MEFVDLYDEKGNWKQSDHPRYAPIPQGLYHKVVSVLVQHESGLFLAMQRSYEKGVTGGYFEVTASGAVQAGETEEEGIRRELEEETGLTPTQWQLLTHFVVLEGQTLYYLYYAVTNAPFDAVKLQAHETIDYRWVTVSQLQTMAEQNQVIGAGAEWILLQLPFQKDQ
ncbi:MAG: NUDIX hydrolase [Aerococcus sp.]|nr:NUDIX hydrolase [Aerococcus sp.]